MLEDLINEKVIIDEKVVVLFVYRVVVVECVL